MYKMEDENMKITTAMRLLLIALSLTMLLSLFSCGENDTQTTDADTSTEADTSETATQADTAKEETETETELPELKLPEASKTMLTGDGSNVSFSENVSAQDYEIAIAYLQGEGFSTYSADTIGISARATLTKDDEYYALVYNTEKCELTVVHSESGAKALPAQSNSADYEKLCDTTVTQHYSKEINGMGYVFRLEDGSFIVYDGGYQSDAKDLLLTIKKLRVTDDVHIRAWIITHDHDDHYTAFNEMAKMGGKGMTIDYVMYSPTTAEEAKEPKYYAEQLHKDVEKLGGKLISIHAGMTFSFADVKLEILQTPSMLSVHGRITDFNDTSIISRVVNDNGSIMMLADACGRSAEWLVANIGDGLKSDMVQVAHHGVETGSIPLYDAIAAPTLFWPCDQSLFASQRGEKIKQHIIEAEYSVEHILHSYGNVTRTLAYRPTSPEAMDIMPTDTSLITTDSKGNATNVRIEDGVLRFDIADPTDPHIVIDFSSIDLGDKNEIRMVVDSSDAKDGNVYLQTANDHGFTDKKSIPIGNQGVSDDGKTTYIIYLGAIAGFEDGLKALRIDFGLEAGQTIDIYSMVISNLDLSEK